MENTTPKTNTTTAPAKSFSTTNRKSTFSNSKGSYAGGKGGRPAQRTFDRPKPDFEQKIIEIRRVTRVVAGGRRLRFSVAMVIGDKKGAVGLGIGKAADTSIAISKALIHAKKNLVQVNLTKTNSIIHDVDAKFGSCRISIMPNKSKGLVAGSAVRDLLSLGGIQNVTAKIHSGSKSKINNVKAILDALLKVGSRKFV